MSKVERQQPRTRSPVYLWRWLVPLVVILAVIGIWRTAPRPETPLLELNRSDLTLRDGKWYRRGETNGFRGIIIERYPDGPLQSRSAVSNGLLNGVSEGWYTNGQLQVREYFKNNLSHGQREKWYESGTNLSTAAISEGILNGPFRRWHDNGQLAEEMEMKDGKPSGMGKAYYPSGALKAEIHFNNGEIVKTDSWDDSASLPLVPKQ